MEQLLHAIDAIDRIGNDEWLATLDDRKRTELEFHNRDRDPEFRKQAASSSDTFEKFYGNKKYYGAARRSKLYVDNWIADHGRGRIFLDYACGNGQYALHAAKSGAKLALGFDISDVSVQNARRNAAGLTNIRYFQADAENTRLPDECIDAVICSGMLHHLDLSFAFPELRRILKPGGKVLAVEALDYNPAIKLYRSLTPDMRTEWEKAHILSLKDLAFAGRFFEVTDVKYWHVVGYAGGKFPALLPALDALDRLLEVIPLANRLAWIFTFCLVKPPRN
ncbi:MAG: Ubiquinone/menaquinone biosynthesis C-methyltransferase UbiE [Steroidobacteraceae bacterium]|nr:Ubiquinone/menaquinone biosynthesis C-methyltransferase UbiE [Steroidobacteraceae bacterium]